MSRCFFCAGHPDTRKKSAQRMQGAIIADTYFPVSGIRPVNAAVMSPPAVQKRMAA